MDVKIKEDWLKALRSGDYKQADSRLLEEKPRGRTFCCLGVLCDIQGIDWSKVERYGTSVVPDNYNAGLSISEQHTLARYNDNGLSFAEIADHIERNL